MYWSKIFKVILILTLLTLLIPLAIARGQTVGTAVISDTANPPDGTSDQHQLNLSDQIQISLTNLAPLGADKAYEGWLISDDGSEKLSVGVFTLDTDGNVSQTFIDPNGVNLFSKYDKFVVMVEPVPDSDPGPSGVVSHSHQIPAGGILHIRHLRFSWPGNPVYAVGPHQGIPKGIAVGLQEQTGALLHHATLSVDSTTLASVQLHACHVVNIAEGADGPDFDSTCGNPGDGFGVLNYAADTAVHAGLALRDAPGDPNIATFEPDVTASANNVADWAGQARDNALLALGTNNESAARAFMLNAQTLARRTLQGFDADSDGTIEPITGEGGALQACIGVQNMGGYTPTVVTAPPQLPKTGDTSLGLTALIALLAGVTLLSGGGYLYLRTRQARS